MSQHKISNVVRTQVTKLNIRFDHWGWANFYLEDLHPGAGQLVINSDWGCWAYAWGHMGKTHTLASFLLTANNDYVINKLLQGRTTEFCADATIVKLKEQILTDRREGCLDTRQARELWDALEHECEHDLHDLALFVERLPHVLDEWLCHEPWEHVAHRPTSTYRVLDETILPALKTVLAQQERGA